MTYRQRLFVLFFVIAVCISGARSTAAQQPTSLVADTDRNVKVTRGGSAQSFHIASAILKETRKILIVLPASYSQSAPTRRYPVTVVADGDFLTTPVAVASDELARNGQIPESVIVGIENFGATAGMSSDVKRVYDLTPPGLSVSGSNLNQGGDLFLDFIEKELLPAVDRQFRTAAPRAFVGVSSGAILATYAAATRSTYCAVVALDPPINLDDNWLAKKMTGRTSTGTSPVRYASLEAKFGWPDSEWKTLVAKAPASWRLYHEKFQLEGHETMWMLGAYIGLRQVFGEYSRLSAPDSPATSILPYYAKLGEALGGSVLPPKRVLQDVTNDLLAQGRGAAAKEAYNMLVSGYGAPANGAELLGKIAEVERRPAPAETVEGLLGTPFPTPEEARAFIGDWVGDIWLGDNRPAKPRKTLRISVENGRVIAEILDPGAPEEMRARRVEYLRVTDKGLTYGFMNGMRPRGVAMFEGTLTGDTLSGKMRFGGVAFDEPAGAPPLQFSFKRIPK